MDVEMVVKNTTIHIARVSTNFSLEDYSLPIEKRVENVNEKILGYFNKTGNLVDNPSINWRFGDIEQVGKIVFGRLGKIRKERLKNLFDEKGRKFISVKAHEESADFCDFLFSLDKHILVFEERKPNIGYKEFMAVFQGGYDKFTRQTGNMAITLFANRDVAEHITQSEKVLSVSFRLRPSNPDTDKENKLVDEELKKMQADIADIKARSKKGLNFKEKSLLTSAMGQANKGYGTYKMSYAGKAGQILTFSSKNKTLKETIRRPTEEAEMKKKLLEQYERAASVQIKKK